MAIPTPILAVSLTDLPDYQYLEANRLIIGLIAASEC